MSIKYPVKIKVTSVFLEELKSCEAGREEDAAAARDANDEQSIKANNYDCVFNDFSSRHKTLIECRTDKELKELYYVCASGTIGLRGYTNQANRVLDQIRDMVHPLDPELVSRFPYQDGC